MDRWFFYACLLGAVLSTRIQPVIPDDTAEGLMLIPFILILASPAAIFISRHGYRVYAALSALGLGAALSIEILIHQNLFLIDSLLLLLIITTLVYEVYAGDQQRSGIDLSAGNLLLILLAVVSVYSAAHWYGPDLIWFRLLPFILTFFVISYPVANRVLLRTAGGLTLTVIVYHSLIIYQRDQELLKTLVSIPHFLICLTAVIRSLNMPTPQEIDLRMTDWIESNRELPVADVEEYGDCSAKITIYPWTKNPNRFIPHHYRTQALRGLDAILTSWEGMKGSYAGDTDLQLWVFGTYPGLSEAVCAGVPQPGDRRTNYFDPVAEPLRFSPPPRYLTMSLPGYAWERWQVIDREYEYLDDLTAAQMRRLRRKGYHEVPGPERSFQKVIDTVWVGRKK